MKTKKKLSKFEVSAYGQISAQFTKEIYAESKAEAISKMQFYITHYFNSSEKIRPKLTIVGIQDPTVSTMQAVKITTKK